VSTVLPRLDRGTAAEIIAHLRELPLPEVSSAMPEIPENLTYSPVGGQRVGEESMANLRRGLMEIAIEHGMPGPIREVSEWESRSARFLHSALVITPHEASQEEVWSYLTCCWLLDVAIWRFPEHTGVDRFVGHLNRNTFRRMWWRAEVLGPEVDLARLGEDELVNIMERPNLWADRRLARAIALEFCHRVESGHVDDRMRLMREATKRLLRLTPFVGFHGLDDDLVRTIASDAFDTAAAGLAGEASVMPQRVGPAVTLASSEVRPLSRVAISPDSAVSPQAVDGATSVLSFDEVAEAALAIARQTGRVTNGSLREVIPVITSEEALEVFRVLIERGELARRGVKRGTHYILPTELPRGADQAMSESDTPASPAAQPSPSAPVPPAVGDAAPGPVPVRPLDRSAAERPSETALRRLIRRMR
jgi:hypothetical protein